MPIEFRCTGCQKLLRTQEGTEGKQAKCPVCGTLVLIPNPNVPPPLPGDAPSPIPASVVSAALPPVDSAPGPLPSELALAPLDIPAVLWSSWQIFLKNIGPCILATLVAGAIGFAAVFVTNAALGGAGRMDLAHRHGGGPQFHWFLFGSQPLASLANLFVSSLLTAGLAVFFLKIARGQPAEIVDVLSGWRWALHAFLAHLACSIIISLGLIFCIVPGVLATLVLSQTMFLVVDRNASAISALEMSHALTSGNKLNLFLLWLIVIGLSVASLITCGLGLIFAIPWFGVLWAVTYLKLSGQHVADGAAV
jgi:uncharacterized membrane protein